MTDLLKDFVENKVKSTPVNIKRIGGGFYADVYKTDYKDSDSVIVKIYKSQGIMCEEVSQIQLLSKYALYPMPKVLWTHSADEHLGYDAMAMNFLEGENAGNIYYLAPSKRNALAEQVVDNLLAFHNVHNPEGFGKINSDRYCNTFNEYYKEHVDAILKMAEHLHANGQMSEYIMNTVKEAAEKFDKIFYLPITASSLIHGDYNMWNILADKKTCRVTAVIDPCGCMWGDSEYDLYQLNNANGKHLKLLEKYAEKKQLSENCLQKMAFYELFTEIEHYYNSGYPVMQKRLKKQADSLKKYL